LPGHAGLELGAPADGAVHEEVKVHGASHYNPTGHRRGQVGRWRRR
jgi:hypothetical protein